MSRPVPAVPDLRQRGIVDLLRLAAGAGRLPPVPLELLPLMVGQMSAQGTRGVLQGPDRHEGAAGRRGLPRFAVAFGRLAGWLLGGGRVLHEGEGEEFAALLFKDPNQEPRHAR